MTGERARPLPTEAEPENTHLAASVCLIKLIWPVVFLRRGWGRRSGVLASLGFGSRVGAGASCVWRAAAVGPVNFTRNQLSTDASGGFFYSLPFTFLNNRSVRNQVRNFVRKFVYAISSLTFSKFLCILVKGIQFHFCGVGTCETRVQRLRCPRSSGAFSCHTALIALLAACVLSGAPSQMSHARPPQPTEGCIPVVGKLRPSCAE